MRVSEKLELVKPKCVPPLDESFRPAVLTNRAFQRKVEEAGGGVPLIFALQRPNGCISRYETRVLPEDHPDAGMNLTYAERLFKFLLWQKGGVKIYVGGPKSVGEYIKKNYAPGGAREFDYRFMGEEVYLEDFEVYVCAPEEVPPEREKTRPLGKHLEGCRIGFDLGASDVKVSAVIDGEVIHSEEIVWEPTNKDDPEYHYRIIVNALKKAASKLSRLEAIGGSAAGVYVDNTVRVASLFRGIPRERYEEVRNLFLRIRDEFGVPLEIVNDGEVAALAGAMALDDTRVLGIALGSSEAGGYVNEKGYITDWLNELAFAPIDYSPDAAVDEWSGDNGCGSVYLSQQCVFRHAPKVGIEIPDDLTKAAKLRFVQKKLEDGDEGALKIWKTMGYYLGYAIAHYADFYDIKHVLVLGRCTSGEGGRILLDCVDEVLKAEFPELASRIKIHLPTEKMRRVGQAIAAASLPELGGKKDEVSDEEC